MAQLIDPIATMMAPSPLCLAFCLLLGVCLNVSAGDYYVSLTGGHIPPFTTWADAATNIQDAIDAAADSDTVWVTNGVYRTGGRVASGGLTNRVVLDKALTVRSVNGAEVTTILGQWDPTATNGPLAVRCVWMAQGAKLRGFTIQAGATLSTLDSIADRQGGGVACEVIIGAQPSSSVIESCIISGNASSGFGAGVAGGVVLHTRIVGNRNLGGGPYANGGGTAYSSLINCYVAGNYAQGEGGGAYQGSLVNCTVADNYTVYSQSGGVYGSFATNSIVYFNSNVHGSSANYYPPTAGTKFVNCCTFPQLASSGGIDADPQLMDSYHLAVNSPCRGAGTNLASGSDLDGEPWAAIPSIGCDEPWEAGITGPLAVGLGARYPYVAEGGLMPLSGWVQGRVTRVAWDFGDDSILTNQSLLRLSHVWTNAGDYDVTLTAYNMDHPDGVSADLSIQVAQLSWPEISTSTKSGSDFTLSFPGQPGVRYYIEQTTNLMPPVVWSTIKNLPSTGQIMQFTHTAATNEMQFYRVRVP